MNLKVVKYGTKPVPELLGIKPKEEAKAETPAQEKPASSQEKNVEAKPEKKENKPEKKEAKKG